MSAPRPVQKSNRRKRRRRAASISSSSGDSSSSDSSDGEDGEETAPVTKPAAESMDVDEESSSSSSSSSDSSDSDSDSDDSSVASTSRAPALGTAAPPRQRTRYPTNSPSPPPSLALPSFLKSSRKGKAPENSEEAERREKFKTVYMNKLVEGFGGELEKMREADPTMGSKKLQLLIDSLAAGIDVYNDPSGGAGSGDVDEVGLLIGD